jgi:hypothetical protein
MVLLDGRSVSVVAFVRRYDLARCLVELEHDGATLLVDTSLVGPCPFHCGWLFHVIGELDHCMVRHSTAVAVRASVCHQLAPCMVGTVSARVARSFSLGLS